MRKIFYIICSILLATTACSEIEFDINEDYEKAEISNVEFYNRSRTRADLRSTINTEEGTILVTLKTNQDIADLKIAVTISTGSNISPAMAVGYQDFSEPRVYEITSPNKTVKKSWTITVINP
jgi:hypothetical protein